MKVRALKRFFDQKESIQREENDEFVVNKERAEEMNASAFGRLVEEVKEKKSKEDKKKSGE